jgi:hypothetical protein
MTKMFFAALAVLGMSLATGGPAANAHTFLFPPAQNAGGNS